MIMIILFSVNIEFCEFFCIVQGINATLCLSLRERIRLCSEQGGNLRENATLRCLGFTFPRKEH